MGKLSKQGVLVVIAVLVFFASVFCLINKSDNEVKTKPQDSLFGRGFANTDPSLLGKVADPEYKVSFPRDHYPHNEFDIEWWYLTANLQDEAGNDYGVQWTLFRFRNPNVAIDLNDAVDEKSDESETDSQWNNKQLYMAHASVHSENEHWFSEKFARGNVGNVGVEKFPLKLFIDDWQWQSTNVNLLPAKLNFSAKLISPQNENSSLLLELNLSNNGDYVLQGNDGYSIKSANGKHASHYYSAPFINIEGRVSKSESAVITGEPITVKGNAWFDQEWTSQLFDQATLGWDWLSLHLDNGDKIMAFRMRLRDQTDYITGTYINADGVTTSLLPSDISLSPNEFIDVGSKSLPLSWQLKINSKSVDVRIETTKNDQWNPASVEYYEGTVGVSGTHQGKGFLELTGY